MNGSGQGRKPAGGGARRSGGAKSGGAGRAGAVRGGGGLTKFGKPRPGTGGYGKRKLEGKGPTPPAEMRPGHPAQRRAAAADRAATRSGGSTQAGPRQGGTGSGTRRADGEWRGDGASGAVSEIGRPAKGPVGSSGRPMPRRAPQRDAAASRSGGFRGLIPPGQHSAAASRSGAFRGVTPPGKQRVTPSDRHGDAPEFVVGRNPVVESLRAHVPAMALYVGRVQHDDRIAEAIELAAGSNVAMLEAGLAEMDRLTGGAFHQGLALRVRPYEYAHPDDLLVAAEETGRPPLIVALDGVTDPRNLGAIVRSAAAFGGHGVVVPTRRSAGVTAGAWKSSAGALARVPVARASNLSRALATYREAGLFVVGLDSSGDEEIRDLDLATSPLVLVTGSEGKGMSRIVTDACDMVVRIPIAASTESLNAGIATGIALYEVATVRSRLPLRCHAGVAQLAEQPSCKRQVSGSNPLTGSTVP